MQNLFGALGPALPVPEVGFWVGGIQMKGHGYFIHSNKRKQKRQQKNVTMEEDNKKIESIYNL